MVLIQLRTFKGAFLWTFVAYLIGVILFGAWVRITHAGAGCGSHWPTCHGEIIPIDPSIETIIEYTHRLTSGFLGIVAIVFLVVIIREYGWTKPAKAAVVTLVLIVFEALIGAGIVLKELVASDDSVARAIVIAIHLVNTLFLTASASLAAYWSTNRTPKLGRTSMYWGCVALAVGVILTSMTGAVTALGDTLFPVVLADGASLASHVTADLDPANHFLVRLRIVHPIVAVVVGLAIVVTGFVWSARIDDRQTAMVARGLAILAIVQLIAGMVNIVLAAPGWMQLVHLFLAQTLWIFLVILTDSVATKR